MTRAIRTTVITTRIRELRFEQFLASFLLKRWISLDVVGEILLENPDILYQINQSKRLFLTTLLNQIFEKIKSLNPLNILSEFVNYAG